MAATEQLDDLIGDGKPAAPAKKAAVKKAAPAKKAVAKKVAAPAKKAAAPAAKKAAAKPAKAAPKTTSARGTGKFYPGTPEERDALDKKIGALSKPITAPEAAEKYGVETFKARLSFVRLEAAGKGKTAKTGSVMTFTPKK